MLYLQMEKEEEEERKKKEEKTLETKQYLKPIAVYTYNIHALDTIRKIISDISLLLTMIVHWKFNFLL